MTWDESVVKETRGSQEAECSPKDVTAVRCDWRSLGAESEEYRAFWIQGQRGYWGTEETCSSAGSHRTYQRYRQGGDTILLNSLKMNM